MIPAEHASLLSGAGGAENKKPQTHTVFNVWSKAHWAFNIFLILLHWADVATDLMVAVELHGLEGGRGRTWCWLIVTGILIAGLSLTFFAIEVDSRHNDEFARILLGRPRSQRSRWWQVLLWYPTTLLIWPFLPAIRILCTALGEAKDLSLGSQPRFVHDFKPWKDPLSGVNDGSVASVEKSRSKKGMSLAAKAELDGIVGSLSVFYRISEGVGRIPNQMIMLFLQTATESIPQAVVQLLAISLVVNPNGTSPTQLASLVVSLLCILSKSYLICTSIDFWIVLSKILCVVYDVLSFAYLVTAVLSPNQPQQLQLFGIESVHVSTLNAIWIYAVFSIMAVTSTCVFMAWVNFALVERTMSPMPVLLVGALGFAPVVACAIGSKLILLAFALLVIEPGTELGAALLLAFLKRNPLEKNAKLCSIYAAGVEIVKYTDPAAARSFGVDEMVKAPKKFRGRDLWSFFLPIAKFEAPCLMIRESSEFRLSRFVARFWLVCTVTFCTLQVFTGIYPFIAFGLSYHQQTVLQCGLFYGCAGCLALLVLVLIPWKVVPYVVFCLDTLPLFRNWFQTYALFSGSLQVIIWETIVRYYVPPHIEAVKQVIPVQSLPQDVAEYLAGFLDPSHVDTSTMDREEIERLKEKVRRERDRGIDDFEGERLLQGDQLRSEGEAYGSI